MDSLTISQAEIFFVFILNGILVSFIFDIFRILRKSFKTPDFITYIEDILFWIITCIILAYSIYIFNNGQIRLYMFIGVFIGTVIYILTVSKYIIKWSVRAINLIKSAVRAIIYYVAFPIRALSKQIKKIVLRPIFFIFINLRKNIYNILQKFSNKSLKTPKIRRI